MHWPSRELLLCSIGVVSPSQVGVMWKTWLGDVVPYAGIQAFMDILGGKRNGPCMSDISIISIWQLWLVPACCL
jgi:hypothetical protein